MCGHSFAYSEVCNKDSARLNERCNIAHRCLCYLRVGLLFVVGGVYVIDNISEGK